MATFQETQVEVDGTVVPDQFGHRCTVYGHRHRHCLVIEMKKCRVPTCPNHRTHIWRSPVQLKFYNLLTWSNMYIYIYIHNISYCVYIFINRVGTMVIMHPDFKISHCLQALSDAMGQQALGFPDTRRWPVAVAHSLRLVNQGESYVGKLRCRLQRGANIIVFGQLVRQASSMAVQYQSTNHLFLVLPSEFFTCFHRVCVQENGGDLKK